MSLGVPEEELAAALRALLRLETGYSIDFAGLLTIGQTENLNYWVEYKHHTGRLVWDAEDLSLEEAISHFLRIRREQGLGYDVEEALIRLDKVGGLDGDNRTGAEPDAPAGGRDPELRG